MGRLDGKVAIVSGAGRGIGRADRQAVCGGRGEGGRSFTDARERGRGRRGHRSGRRRRARRSLRRRESRSDQGRRGQSVAAYGGIDILVNIAFDPSVVLSSVIELSVEKLQRNFDMGPIAYLRMMQACYPHLKASGEGRVINFASLAGVLGLVPYAPYDMAKEAVRALTRIAAREWGADRITVNNVLPVANTWGGDAPPATNSARPARIARRGRRSCRPVPRQQRCAVPDGLQPHR